MKMLKRFRNDESGSTMVIVALSMVALLSILSLVTDFGMAYYNRAKLQASLDSAALAAAIHMDPDDFKPADLAANGKACFDENYTDQDRTYLNITHTSSFVLGNDREDNQFYQFLDTNHDGKYDSVRAYGTLQTPTGFAQIMHINQITVSTFATAICAEIPNPNNPWNRAITSDKNIHFEGSGLEIAGIHSNGEINFGDLSGFVVDGGVSAGNGIRGESSVHYKDGQPITSDSVTQKTEDIGAACQDALNYVKHNFHANESNFDGAHTFSNITKDFSVQPPKIANPGWEYDSGVNILSGEAKYTSTVDASAVGTVKVTGSLYIKGDFSVSELIIAPGATVTVTGKLTVSNGLTCNGNLVVMGDLSVTGFGQTGSTGDQYTVIYVGGSSAVFGQAASNCDNIMIAAPNCDTFTINGGNTTFKGSIVGKDLSGLGSAHLNVIKPTNDGPCGGNIKQFWLTE